MFVFTTSDNFALLITINIGNVQREEAILKGTLPFFLEAGSEYGQVLSICSYQDFHFTIMVYIGSKKCMYRIGHRKLSEALTISPKHVDMLIHRTYQRLYVAVPINIARKDRADPPLSRKLPTQCPG